MHEILRYFMQNLSMISEGSRKFSLNAGCDFCCSSSCNPQTFIITRRPFELPPDFSKSTSIFEKTGTFQIVYEQPELRGDSQIAGRPLKLPVDAPQRRHRHRQKRINRRKTSRNQNTSNPATITSNDDRKNTAEHPPRRPDPTQNQRTLWGEL
jgi:hypothetical protein